ncbi:MAG TPA: hypothetical protein EYG89_05275 [Bacteroidia bacterium]|nr:hypothetical protein [Bacteroidia bacterium]
MKTQEKEYNINFIKTSGIIYAIGTLIAIIYAYFESVNSYRGGGNNGGGAMGIVIYGVGFLIATIVVIILNFLLSKPKPSDKYLIFLPAIILLNIYALASIASTLLWGKLFLSEYQQIRFFALKLMVGILFLIIGFFILRYILSKFKWSKLKKGILLLPILIILIQNIFNIVWGSLG